MARTYQIILLFTLTLLLGCNYKSPITGPETPLDERLLGSWKTGSANGQGARLRFRPLNQFEYLVEYTSEKEGGDYGKCFLSVVDGHRFLNFQDPATSKFGFFGYEIDAKGRLKLRNLQLEVPASSSSFTLRQEIRKKLREGKLFLEENATVWRRIKEETKSKR